MRLDIDKFNSDTINGYLQRVGMELEFSEEGTPVLVLDQENYQRVTNRKAGRKKHITGKRLSDLLPIIEQDGMKAGAKEAGVSLRTLQRRIAEHKNFYENEWQDYADECYI